MCEFISWKYEKIQRPAWAEYRKIKKEKFWEWR